MSEQYHIRKFSEMLIRILAVWVKWWSEANTVHPNQSVGMYIGVYVMLGVLGTLSACVAAW